VAVVDKKKVTAKDGDGLYLKIVELIRKDAESEE
jgi:hypothetical protein